MMNNIKYVATPVKYRNKAQGYSYYGYVVSEPVQWGHVTNLSPVDFVEVNHWNDFDTMADHGYTVDNTAFFMNGRIGAGMDVKRSEWNDFRKFLKKEGK